MKAQDTKPASENHASGPPGGHKGPSAHQRELGRRMGALWKPPLTRNRWKFPFNGRETLFSGWRAQRTSKSQAPGTENPAPFSQFSAVRGLRGGQKTRARQGPPPVPTSSGAPFSPSSAQPPHPGTGAWGGGQCSGWGESRAGPLKGSCVRPLFSEPFSFFIALGILQCRGPKPLQSKHMKNSPQPILNIYGFS